MLTTFPEAVKTVVNGDRTASGFVQYMTNAELGGTLRETVSGTCMILADDIGVVSYENALKIDGKTVYVTSQDVDMLGVVNTFQFTSTNPATGDV